MVVECVLFSALSIDLIFGSKEYEKPRFLYHRKIKKIEINSKLTCP